MHNYFEDYDSLGKAKLHTFTSIAFIDGAEHFVTLLIRSTLYVNFNIMIVVSVNSTLFAIC